MRRISKINPSLSLILANPVEMEKILKKFHTTPDKLKFDYGESAQYLEAFLLELEEIFATNDFLYTPDNEGADLVINLKSDGK